MDEYIERETIKAAMIHYGFKSPDMTVTEFVEDELPAADVAPVRHGRWIDAYPDIEANPMFMYGICSECGFEQGISKYLNYCPNCGARMTEDIDEQKK